MKAIWTGIAVVALAAGGAATAHPGHWKAAIAAALADPARADQAGDDARRQAAAVIEFAGVKPGDRVVDLIPGAGYWSRIFSPLVGPKGHVIAMWPQAAAKYAEKSSVALRALGLANLTVDVQATPILTVDAPVDVVWTVQNYHDIANNGGGEAALLAVDAMVFKMLKPGGTYIVVDHADAPGSGISDTSTLHRIDPAVVKATVTKAGFSFVGESNVLRNPADDHKLKVFDPAIRGHTDQFVYKFRRP